MTFQHGKAVAYTEKRTRQYAESAGWYAKQVMLEEREEKIPKEVGVKMSAFFIRKGKPMKRPDIFNMLMQIADTLQGICYVDDCQVAEVHAFQIEGSMPMTRVVIESLPTLLEPETKKHKAASKKGGNKGNK